MIKIFLPLIILAFLSTPLTAQASTPIASIYAEPGPAAIAINYQINDSGTGHVILEVESPDNQTVRTIDCGIKASGSYVAVWDGRDDNGAVVPVSNYMVWIDYFPEAYTINATWGGEGNGDGQFDNPAGIALDGEGNVYVADTGNHRVQKLDTSGRLITAWGGRGSGDGQFEYPAGIAVSDDGIVYVADLGNSRIQMFSTDGGYVSQWGSAGSGDGEFSLPHGIAADGSGDVYVADTGNHRVQKFTSNGKFISSFGSYGKKDGFFMSPAGVAVYQGILFVTDIDRNNVQSFTTDGAFLNSRGSSGQFNGACGVAADGRHVYVTDINNHKVQKFEPGGALAGMVDCYGRGEGRPAAPTGIAADKAGNIFITDSSNDNVHRLFYDPARGGFVVQNSTNISLDSRSIEGLSTSAIPAAAVSLSGNGPATYINLTGTAGNGSWYRSNVTVTLNAYAKSGTLIAGTYYRLNSGGETKYEGPFDLTGEGTTTVSYYSVDNTGNAEPMQSVNVRIDKTPPAVTGTVTGGDGWHTGSAVVRFSADPKDLSGVVYVSPDQTISENGVSEVTGSAYDLAGNIGTCTVTVKIDNKPPATSISLSGTAGGNGWYTSDVLVNFSATDGESGVNKTEYSLDGGIWKPAVPFVVNHEGVTTIYYRSTDTAGNVEPENTMMVKIDKTAPAISGTVRDPDFKGWYTGPVTVTFSASDIYSGVAPGSVTQPVTLPLKDIPLDGPHQSVTGTATDNAGNKATAVVGNLNIDMYPPATACTLDGAGGGVGDNAWYRTNVTVTLSPTDAGSGVNYTMYNRNGTGWRDYHPFVISDEGITDVSYYSVDNVNHMEPVRTALARIDKTPPKVTCVNVTQPNGDGWYTEPVVIHFIATDERSGVSYVTPDITLSSDGTNQTVTGYATDVAGNTGSVTVSGYNVDLSAPVTTCVLNRTPNEDGWFSGDVGASLSSTDMAATGVEAIRYSFDGMDWQTYHGPQIIPVHDEGVNVLYYYSTDNFSHVEPMNAQNIKIDNTPPTLAYQILSGARVDGWYTQNVTVHFVAADAVSGIKSVTPDVVLANDGIARVVSGTATDLAGHSVSIQTSGIDIDMNPPVTTCSLSGTMGNNGWYKSAVDVMLNADDGDGSGVSYTQYMLDNGSWMTGSQLTISEDGPHTIYYRSADRLNNTEAVKSLTLKIDRTPPALTGITIPQPTQYGWFKSAVVVHFAASDNMSGLASVTPDVTLSGEGAGQAATGNATDNAGNTASTTVAVNIDKAAPSTGYTLEGTAGAGGWNTSDVKVTLSSDDLSLLNIWHSFDNKNWNADNPFVANKEGSQTVYYYAEDRAGNKEAVKSFGLKIDKTAPTVAYDVSGTHGLVGAYRSDVAVSFVASDNGTSGLAGTGYSLDGNTWKPLANFTLTAEGDYNIPYNASDNAGNKASGVIVLTIDKTAPAVNATAPETGAEGVLVDGKLVVTFNGLLDPASVNNSTVTLTDADGNKVNGSVRYASRGNVSDVTFIPDDALSPYTSYTLSISADVKDPSGNHLASPYALMFATGNMDSAGNEVAPPLPTSAPTTAPGSTPKPGGLSSIPVVPILIFFAILAVGGLALIYLTRIRK